MNKSTAVLADAVDPRAIGTDTMRAMHYRYQYNPDALHGSPSTAAVVSRLLQRWATSHTQELHAYVSRAKPMGRMPCKHGQVYEACELCSCK